MRASSARVNAQGSDTSFLLCATSTALVALPVSGLGLDAPGKSVTVCLSLVLLYQGSAPAAPEGHAEAHRRLHGICPPTVRAHASKALIRALLGGLSIAVASLAGSRQERCLSLHMKDRCLRQSLAVECPGSEQCFQVPARLGLRNCFRTRQEDWCWSSAGSRWLLVMPCVLPVS